MHGSLAGFWAFQTWFVEKRKPESSDKSTQVTAIDLDEELKQFKSSERDARRASFKSAAYAIMFTQSRRLINGDLSPGTTTINISFESEFEIKKAYDLILLLNEKTYVASVC